MENSISYSHRPIGHSTHPTSPQDTPCEHPFGTNFRDILFTWLTLVLTRTPLRYPGAVRVGYAGWKGILLCCMIVLSLVLSACGEQSQQVDSRLKYFKVLSSRVLIVGNNAEVFGELENTSKMKFPFDVTLQANLMDTGGQSVGTATGTAEDVGLGQVRQFLLTGNVDGTRYARLKVTAVSLQEKRIELNLPTPTPISP